MEVTEREALHEMLDGRDRRIARLEAALWLVRPWIEVFPSTPGLEQNRRGVLAHIDAILAQARSEGHAEADARIKELEEKLVEADEMVSRFNKDSEMQSLMATNNALRARLEAAQKALDRLSSGAVFHHSSWGAHHSEETIARMDFARSVLSEIAEGK